MWHSKNDAGERGNGLIEFVGILAGIILPSLLILVAVADVMAAHQAASAGAREGARAYVRADSDAEGHARLHEAVREALEARGMEAGEAPQLECSARPCLSPGSEITVRVRVNVASAFLGQRITVASSAHMAVDELRQQRP